MQEIASTPEPETRVDVRVPYDAAAQLAYAASDKKMPYPDFKIQYEAEAVALVKSKQQPKKKGDTAATPEASMTVDLSVPYDAAAKLAFEASDKKMDYADFKLKYEKEAVELVKSKQPKKETASSSTTVTTSATVTADLSVPYDAAAQLAYAATDKSIPFADFKIKYEAEAVELVKSKRK